MIRVFTFSEKLAPLTPTNMLEHGLNNLQQDRFDIVSVSAVCDGEWIVYIVVARMLTEENAGV